MLVVPLEGKTSIEVCDVQVGLTMQPLEVPVTPSNTTGGGGSGGLSGGAIAGIVIGAAAGVAILAAGAVYAARRRRLGQAPAQQQAGDGKWEEGSVRGRGGGGLPGLPPGVVVAGAAGAAGAVAASNASASAGSAQLYTSPTGSGGVGTPLAAHDQAAAARASGGSSTFGSADTLAATDLTRLPQGFNDGGWRTRGCVRTCM